MTQEQICQQIIKNKACCILIKDYSGNKLFEVIEKTPHKACDEFADNLKDFAEYKKLEVIGKKDNDTAWSLGYKWQLDMSKKPGEQTTTGNMPGLDGRISATEYIGMFTKMHEKQMELQTALMKQTLEIKNKDVSQYIPLIREIAPMLGMNTASTIQGNPNQGAGTQSQKKDTVVQDVKTDGMSATEISVAVGEKLASLSKKIQGSDMLKLLNALDGIEDLRSNIEKLNKVLIAFANKPELLDLAITYLK